MPKLTRDDLSRTVCTIRVNTRSEHRHCTITRRHRRIQTHNEQSIFLREELPAWRFLSSVADRKQQHLTPAPKMPLTPHTAHVATQYPTHSLSWHHSHTDTSYTFTHTSHTHTRCERICRMIRHFVIKNPHNNNNDRVLSEAPPSPASSATSRVISSGWSQIVLWIYC